MRWLLLGLALVAAYALYVFWPALPIGTGADGAGRLAIARFFDEPTAGGGMVRTWLDTERFDVATEPRREGDVLRMAEWFLYTTGRRRLQDWTIRAEGEDFVATRPDLKGPVRFRRTGPHSFSYTWYQWLKPEEQADLVTLRGWLALRADGVLVNRAVVFKYGIPVGGVRVTFRRSA